MSTRSSSEYGPVDYWQPESGPVRCGPVEYWPPSCPDVTDVAASVMPTSPYGSLDTARSTVMLARHPPAAPPRSKFAKQAARRRGPAVASARLTPTTRGRHARLHPGRAAGPADGLPPATRRGAV